MDGPRFDDLARAVARRATRRALLRGVGGALAGAVLGARGGPGADAASCAGEGEGCGERKCCGGKACLGDVCCPNRRVCGAACCPPGATCDGGACVAQGGGGGGGGGRGCPDGSVRVGRDCLLVQGQPCADGGQCATGHCAGGVCCDGACDDPCHVCDPSTQGICTPLTGPVCDAGTACRLDSTCQGGACVGGDPLAAGTECGEAPRCENGFAFAHDACDGGGACQTATATNCAPFVCGETACLPSCGSEDDCVDGHYCDGGACLPKQQDGTACSGEDRCLSGHCVDGVCCATDCVDQCGACNLPSSLGVCSPVTGQPVGPLRRACATDGSVCGGACDGTRTDACAYPDVTTTCVAASCAGGVETLAQGCDGAGRCPTPATEACAPYLCGATACTTECAIDDDCAGPAYCNASVTPGVCREDLAAGQDCLRGAQCLSGHCAAGVCCDSACPPPANATATCPDGQCGFVCDTGFHTCDGQTCVSDTSPDTCGPTGCAPCPDGPANSTRTCTNGQCGFACDAGRHLCDGQCLSDASPDSCGSSCAPCPAGPANSTRTCTDGQCGWACSSGFHLCSGQCLSDTSPDSCGASCTPCPNGPANSTRTCANGACGYVCNFQHDACGNECIHFSQCCTSAECVNAETCHGHACCAFPRICGTAPNDFCCPSGQRCSGATCAPCLVNGGQCSADSQCCSGDCSGGGEAATCVCLANGQFCSDGPQCCSGACRNGFCCGLAGAFCNSAGEAAQCCSGVCGGTAPNLTCT